MCLNTLSSMPTSYKSALFILFPIKTLTYFLLSLTCHMTSPPNLLLFDRPHNIWGGVQDTKSHVLQHHVSSIYARIFFSTLSSLTPCVMFHDCETQCLTHVLNSRMYYSCLYFNFCFLRWQVLIRKIWNVLVATIPRI